MNHQNILGDRSLNLKSLVLGIFLIASPLSSAWSGDCAGVLVNLRPRIERLFGVPVWVLDAAVDLRERTVGDLKVVSLDRLFEGKNETFLGFGLPNVYTTVPDGKGGYEKFAAKSVRRADATVEDTRGFVQSGVFLRFKNLPAEAVQGLQAAIRDPKNHIRHWTCVNANCQIFDQAGFHLKDGFRMTNIYFPVHLLKTLIQGGLYYKGQRVEFDIIRTSPSFLHWYGMRQFGSELDTLRRHAKKANPKLGKALYSLDPIARKIGDKIFPKSPPIDPWIKNAPIADLATAKAAFVDIKVSSTSTATALLTQLWGAHNLYEVKPSARADINAFLPKPLKEFDRPKKDLFTLLKQYILFSPLVIKAVRKALVKSLVDIGSQSVADLHSMLPVHTEKQPAKFNLVMTPQSITLAYLNSGKVKTMDWLLTKHVLISDYAIDVRFAGEVWKGEDGIIYVSNDSGSYRPGDDDVDQAVAYLKAQFPGTEVVGIKAGQIKKVEKISQNPKPSKISEIFQKLKGLDRAYWSQVRMIREIYKTQTSKKNLAISLKDLLTIHSMDGVAESKIAARASILKDNADTILAAGTLTIDDQQRLIPSNGNMRVIRDRSGRYVLIDGNGRFKAIQMALGESPDLKVEVEYIETSSESVLDKLEWIRKYRGLIDG